jgi:hypothetical protein
MARTPKQANCSVAISKILSLVSKASLEFGNKTMETFDWLKVSEVFMKNFIFDF